MAENCLTTFASSSNKMTVTVCDKCKAAHLDPDDAGRAARFAAAGKTLCGCEGGSVSEHSPGPVGDDEVIQFIVTDPQWIMDNGQIHPAAFMRVDVSGLSALRENALDCEFDTTMRELAERAANSNKECFFHGTLSFKAFDVRYCMSDRVVCVYDTGLKDKPNHVELMCAPIAGPTRSQIEKKRRGLIKNIIEGVGNQLTSCKEFRGGLLQKYARNP
jgi:hypothetical protein